MTTQPLDLRNAVADLDARLSSYMRRAITAMLQDEPLTPDEQAAIEAEGTQVTADMLRVADLADDMGNWPIAEALRSLADHRPRIFKP